MSVVAQSPYSGVKRLFEDEPVDNHDSCDRQQRFTAKRARYHRASPAGRCFHPYEQSYGPSLSTLAALRAIFPDMDDQTVSNVLAECGDNIDAAIKRLNELKLSTNDQPNPVNDQPTPAPEPSQQQETSSSSPTSPQQWIDVLVQQMTAASSVDDARQRAANVLQSFEQFTMSRTQLQAAASEEKAQQLQAKLDEALKENHILKRAVQIQNARVQEAAQKEQEIQHLNQIISQHREQLRQLELSNYSLTLHLQQATHGSSFSHQRNPDVF